jgi:deoxycytidylate deaminase
VGLLAANDILSHEQADDLATSISDRLSQELVIALVGPVGSGVSTTAGYLKDILSQDFGYAVHPIIKPSDIIQREARRVGISSIARSPLDAYITDMQSAGNKLREKFGGDYLSEKIVEQIHKFRRESGGYTSDGKIVPKRIAYIIDSLKNTDELHLLRQIYGETLCVIGIFAPDAQRKSRLIDAGVPEENVKKIIDRDQGEVATFGQKTRKLFVQSDFFVCNDRKVEELRTKISRFLNIIFDTKIHTPTRSEAAMYKASSSAANSACMSRQVGAAIVSREGELIAVGWNDVPKFGGGLYNEDDQSVYDDLARGMVDKDRRCFKWSGCVCHNETRLRGIIHSVSERIAASGLLRRGAAATDVVEALYGSEIDSLIEFSRSIHAEMEAILSVAREGKNSLVGATLYTNTYPCHNCARHIVASGITKVIYIEPYLKSLALALHHDAITEDPDDRSRVVFQQYDGVAPASYLRLFRPAADRKKDGVLLRKHLKEAVPIFRIPLDSQTAYEDKVIAELSVKEQDRFPSPVQTTEA